MDAVITRKRGGIDEVLLIRRGREPFLGMWALPGGFVDQDEDLPQAAARELWEETGIRANDLTQVGAFGKPGRDPRHRTVSVVFAGRAEEDARAVAADDASHAEWYPLGSLPPLAFDHAEIIESAKKIMSL